MTRAYYTCPLKAAFMAEYHGMQFDGFYLDGINRKAARIATIFRAQAVGGCLDSFAILMPDEKYYIHPDSMGILEPVEGDVWRDGLLIGAVIEGGKRFYFEYEDFGVDLNNGTIIQRNGEAFFWPEFEEK